MKLLFFTISLLLLSSSIYAQVLIGTVVNQNQLAIKEANILNKTTNEHNHTNAHGSFSLKNVSIGDILKFSRLGYQSEEVIVKDLSTSLIIVLYPQSINLDEIIITSKVNTLQLITDVDIQTNPVNSSQDILRKVPGLFIGQHAGGGKAEQIFLRGFDIDHGTDINLTVDGLPVNMVSHAHGQGYADLHFVIPETIDKVDFGKGVYYEDKGNFATAGYVDFKTKENLNTSMIKLEAGQFDTYRFLGMFNIMNTAQHNAYVASEYLSTDSFFDSPQNFNRINILGKYTGFITDSDKLGVTVSNFSSKWDASGQIPQRAVDSGLISRFGAIDDTEGGNTSRTNFLVNYDKIINKNSTLKNSVYWSAYDFELYSNFTFLLEDPINGDQIRQKEGRTIFGLNSEYQKAFSGNKVEGTWQAGISLRNDQSKDNQLSRSRNRIETLEQIQFGDINETNFGAYLGANIHLNKWTFNPSIRVDYFDFQYNNALLGLYKTQEETEAAISPKLNIFYNASNELQVYAKAGKGFHSNDTRVVVARGGETILPSALGTDIGFVWKPTSKMLFNLAYWYLYLEQEFVYVGDAGIVEPSGETRRQGIDLSYRYQIFPWLFCNLDANYTHARSIDEPSDADYIPLAADFTLMGGFNVLHKSGFFGSVNVQHLNDRPANEDNSIVAEGYTITNLNVGYKWKKMSLSIQIQNLFDQDWNETQFATESRLTGEPQSVEEIHFTPGTPFFLKTTVQYNF
ncbi:outer membrane receptor protein involved in Fe transport [Aquimarina sp. MAR_2010_214]|uniref:TonB-dependent receptor n=1 Tax=Aquimarina sp. MAR_2010_214 TaxID=1250026 RepID=UPI000C6FDA6C|nr:TonB-dependent receptor [Aquimarina sp. MAR_2010_214]PKV48039.1 outer membrane receptor protein involved in Fe transport [Aquimarina sp. MAR_2010_214]